MQGSKPMTLPLPPPPPPPHQHCCHHLTTTTTTTTATAKVKYCFHCADSHETQNSSVHFLDISFTEFYSNQTKSIYNTDNTPFISLN
jgi:hypothetical protein